MSAVGIERLRTGVERPSMGWAWWVETAGLFVAGFFVVGAAIALAMFFAWGLSRVLFG